MKISVITCAHNSRQDYLSRVWQALKGQTFDPGLWEYLFVDNSSEPPIEPGSMNWHPARRFFRELRIGLTPARLLGIRQARGELLVFVDDDNVLDPDFLEVAWRVAGERPFLGAWSGQCRPQFELPPPEWTRRYWGNLVIREFERDVWSNLPRLPDSMPCGAGLCVRREVAKRYLALHEQGARAFQFDRTGDSLLSGGDNDLAACACDIGLGVGLISALKLSHLIPPERLTEDYLARLAEGIQFSGTLLDAKWGNPSPPRSALGHLIDALRTLRLSAPHRQILSAAYRGRNQATKLIASSANDQND